MNILKKIGQILNAADQYIPMYGSLIHAVTNSILPGKEAQITTIAAAVTDGLHIASKIVVDAEIAGQAAGLAGPQKMLLTGPALAQLFLDLPVLQGRKPKDAEKFKADAAKLGGAIADLLNDFED